MENMIFALIIIFAVIIFTIVNSVIICGICDEMIAYIDADEIAKACELWKSKEKYISLFVKDSEIDIASSHIHESESLISFEDGEAESAKMRLIDAILEIRKSESVSWESIF